jgi:hypothetical protein
LKIKRKIIKEVRRGGEKELKMDNNMAEKVTGKRKGKWKNKI